MSTAREEIMNEAAEWLARPGLIMVNELTDTPNSARTVFVGAARVNDAEGIVHVVQTGRKHVKTYAKFTSDDEYRAMWGRQ